MMDREFTPREKGMLLVLAVLLLALGYMKLFYAPVQQAVEDNQQRQTELQDQALIEQDRALKMRTMEKELEELAPTLVSPFSTAESVYATVGGGLTVEEDTGHSTAYDALIEGVADSEGAALAYQLLCDQAGVECTVVRGTLYGEPHFWNIANVGEDGIRHVDLSAGLFSLTDEELTERGVYEWDRGEYPACVFSAANEEIEN